MAAKGDYVVTSKINVATYNFWKTNDKIKTVSDRFVRKGKKERTKLYSDMKVI